MLHSLLAPLVVASLSVSLATFSGNTTASGTTIAGGLFHTCMIVSDLSLRCFGGGSSEAIEHIAPTGSVVDGFGNFGQIGSGDNKTLGDEEGEMGSALAAVDIGINTAQDVTAGQSHTCVMLTSGGIACFGYNFYGQLGLGDMRAKGLSPSDMGEDLALVDLGTNRTASRIGSGQHHSCAVLDDGSLKCWGKNDRGMLGLGDTRNRGSSIGEMGDDLPSVDLGTGRTAVSVSGGRYHTCALLDNATLKCWGGNNSTGKNYGQLGQGNTLDVGSSEGQMGDALPAIDLGENRTVVAFDLGWYHTCALLDDSSLKCFGRNFDGQLGLGDTEDRGNEPGEMGDDLPAVDLGTGRYAVAITCGRWHTCVLLDNDDVKCFGANTSDDLGAGQLGLEDSENRGRTVETTGDGLETVQLGIGRTSGWIFAAFDHTCVIFDDAMSKCWGLNTSGQLGLGNTNDVGANEGTMGEALPAVEPGLRLAFPTYPAAFGKCSVSGGPPCTPSEAPSSTSSESRSTASPAPASLTPAPSVARYSNISSPPVSRSASPNRPKWAVFLAAVVSALGVVVLCLVIACCRLRHKRQAQSRNNVSTAPSTFDDTQRERDPTGMIGGTTNATAVRMSNIVPGEMAPEATGMAALGATGVMIASAYYGWDVVNRVAETLPWIGAAFYLLNDLVDIIDTKFELEGNLERIRGWALCLREVILQISRQIEIRQSDNAQSLRYMSMDVISSLEELVATATEWEKKGMLAQYVASRSCKRAVDAADTALRGALQRLTVGQGAELMTMVSGLENAGLVVTEKLDMVFEQLRKQEETTARLELRLAQYSEATAEALGEYIRSKTQRASEKKTLRELGKEALDRLQIPKEDIKYASNIPFATGAFSEVYQVIHEGVVKAAKKTNLRRLGLRAEGTDRVFGRFVKELYILSRMRSDRVVSVYGAVATPTELTLVMEFVERGSLRSILDDDAHREQMTPAVKHRLLTDTAEGMKYLYDAGVEHRDLKSANCLITHDWRAKISDFGLSKTTDAISTGSTSAGGSFPGGTLIYVAPELLIAGLGLIQEVPAELSDVYSFGVIVWDVLCGKGELPWAHLNATQLLLKLRRGEHLTIPAECDHFYRTLMKNCWNQCPQRRPRFELILRTFNKKTFSTEDMPPLAVLSSVGAAVQEMRGSSRDLPGSSGERHRTPSGPQVGLVGASRSSAGQKFFPHSLRGMPRFYQRDEG